MSAIAVGHKRLRGIGPEDYTPLDWRYMRLHVPDRVCRTLLDDLIRGGILECDDRYYFGPYVPAGGRGKCLCYRLGPGHRAAKLVRRPVTHRELLRKMRDAYTRERDAVLHPTHLGLRRWHDRVELTPDAPRGEHVLLDLMHDGERWFSVCEMGRVHTNVANMPRQYRRYIRLDGRELASVDVSTSQPLLLALFVRFGESLAKPKLRRPSFKRRSQEYDNTGFRSGGWPVSPSSPLAAGRSDAFLNDCLRGVVYDRIAERTGYSRDEVKPLFLAVIYGHPEHMGTKVGNALRELYPAVFDAVVEANTRLGHGGLPRLMQLMESRVMISRVAGRLLRERPAMPMLTVHDSVLVPPEYAPDAEAVIGDEWQAEFGVRPRTKRTDFTAPQEPRSRA